MDPDGQGQGKTVGTSSNKKSKNITITIENFDTEGLRRLMQRITNAFKKEDTPEGYNSNKRFMSRWILWVAVFSMILSRYLIAIICSASSIIVLKEGTIFSTKNLKWMILSMISFAASVTSYSLRRAYDSIGDDHGRFLKLILRLSSKWICTVS